jgi:hypothetical protein
VTPEAALLELLSAAAQTDAEDGDHCVAFLPSGEALLFLQTPYGLAVRRHATDAEVGMFLTPPAQTEAS